ncbi:discoidin, CUB and LCCL domain-containing protein 1 isoform X1 [Mobula hypostoma]|uniref:discoidin, CUB and LCCL domain-containing protein 1 isoform X1 n=1 Tax=Mobula hypostoma TaxID=723540 RepID=UPI002FC2B979
MSVPLNLLRFLVLSAALSLTVLRQNLVRGQLGDGCGHTVIGPESGTLTSKGYPGTYPNHTSCRWELDVGLGKSIMLMFSDLDIENTENCSSNSVRIYALATNSSYGPYCRKMNRDLPRIQLPSSAVIVQFQSTTHRTGRGFLLSYATTDHSDMISCLDKGIHYSQQSFTKYCPAGCKGVSGDVWGNHQEGYRDTSVLCKAAVHAGAIADEQGGQVSVTLKKGITLYEAASANGIITRRGPLSEKRIKINKDCSNVLDSRHFTASSSWAERNSIGELTIWSPDKAQTSSKGPPWAWAASSRSSEEWLQIDLGERKNITGIVTKGSTNNGYNFYVKTYKISHSKDGGNWRFYRCKNSKEDKIFQGNVNNDQLVRNNFIPSIVARYIRVIPQQWHERVALKVEVLGCKPSPKSRKAAAPRSPRPLPKPTDVPAESSTPPDQLIVEEHLPGLNLIVVLISVSFLVIIATALLLLCVFWKRRKSGKRMHCSSLKVCDTSVKGQNCHRSQLQPTESDIITFTSEEGSCRSITGNTLSVDYAEPDILQGGITAQKASSTFKPPNDDGYTIPLVVSHYDVPFSCKHHEYAEPFLNQEPEYATPFVEPSAEAETSTKKNVCIVKVIPPVQETL